MNQTILFVIIAVIAYFVGAIPFGMLYASARGVDIRKVGSGNIGATNVARQFGFVGGFLPVFLLDMLKGALPVLAIRLLNVHVFASGVLGADIAMLIAGILAILGHTFPVYIGFKGGKGVATTAGVFLALAPISCAAALGIFLVVFLVSRIVSLSSITAAFCLPFIVYFLEKGRVSIFVLSILVAVLLIYLHKSNIKKLLKGEEKPFEFGKKKEEAKKE
jgi:glycerol-3-phosphate acyltransferase PlsY